MLIFKYWEPPVHWNSRFCMYRFGQRAKRSIPCHTTKINDFKVEQEGTAMSGTGREISLQVNIFPPQFPDFMEIFYCLTMMMMHENEIQIYAVALNRRVHEKQKYWWVSETRFPKKKFEKRSSWSSLVCDMKNHFDVHFCE